MTEAERAEMEAALLVKAEKALNIAYDLGKEDGIAGAIEAIDTIGNYQPAAAYIYYIKHKKKLI